MAMFNNQMVIPDDVSVRRVSVRRVSGLGSPEVPW